jgi:hypothetical protein
MDYVFPPVENVDQLKAELSTIPVRHRDDAVQEAWVAHLEGRDPLQAMHTWSLKEKRAEKRARIETDSESGDVRITGDTPTTNETNIRPRERKLRRKAKRDLRAA